MSEQRIEALRQLLDDKNSRYYYSLSIETESDLRLLLSDLTALREKNEMLQKFIDNWKEEEKTWEEEKAQLQAELETDCEKSARRGEAILKDKHRIEQLGSERDELRDGLKWFFSNSVGMSSRAILSKMLDVGKETSYPHDPSDFERCHRILQLFPEWRDRITEMADVSPEWAALAREWDTLERMYIDAMENGTGKAPEMFKLMCDLTKAAALSEEGENNGDA